MTRELEIIAIAERMIKDAGYNGFSFREIAKEIGIKSSSVHYHFPTKEQLAGKVAQNYKDSFFAKLGAPEDLIDKDQGPITIYTEVFRRVFLVDKKMCLCGMLGAQVDILPLEVATQIRSFFDQNINWLQRAYALLGNKNSSREKAISTLATLEGALILSRVANDVEYLDAAIHQIIRHKNR